MNTKSYSKWRLLAAKKANEIMHDLPQEATLAEIKRALRDGYPFGEKKHWPYKVWREECRTVINCRFPYGIDCPDAPDRICVRGSRSGMMPHIAKWLEKRIKVRVKSRHSATIKTMKGGAK